MKTRQEIKKDARELLDNRIFSDKWLYLALFLFINSLIMSIGSTVAKYTYGAVELLIMLLVGGAMAMGVVRGMLALVRKQDEKADIVKLFSGFDDTYTASLIHNLMKTLFIFLWSLLLIVPGVIKAYSWELSYYYLNDNKDMEYKECFEKSAEKMNGHKWDLFVLDLSFIGWYIVGLLCLGVGVFFVSPYHMTARTMFLLSIYEEGKEEKTEEISTEEAPVEETPVEETEAQTQEAPAEDNQEEPKEE